MQFFDQLLNNTYEFPDGTAPDAIRQAVAPLHEQHFQNTKQQQLVSGMSGLGQAIFNATRNEQRMPVVSPVAAMAMGPNYQSHREAQLGDIRNQQQQRQFDASQQQRQGMANAQQRMQERQMIAQQMEQEKDRSQALHLETQRMKNRQEEMRLQQQAQKEMEQWKQSQPGYDETRGIQYKLNPDTGNYETSVIDQNIYNRATAMPQYGGGGRGGGGAKSGSTEKYWKDGQYWTSDGNGGWKPLVDAGEGTLTPDQQIELDMLSWQMKEMQPDPLLGNYTPEQIAAREQMLRRMYALKNGQVQEPQQTTGIVGQDSFLLPPGGAPPQQQTPPSGRVETGASAAVKGVMEGGKAASVGGMQPTRPVIPSNNPYARMMGSSYVPDNTVVFKEDTQKKDDEKKYSDWYMNESASAISTGKPIQAIPPEDYSQMTQEQRKIYNESIGLGINTQPNAMIDYMLNRSR